MSADAVTLEISDAVGVVTLNRPERLNAVDDTIREAFPARMAEAADRDDVRAIVLTGAGRGFCAGADITVLGNIGAGQKRTMPGRTYLAARSIPKPVIAAVNGVCAGLGLVFALSADVRFSAPSTRFETGFARRGLVAEQAIGWLLTRAVGPSKALDLLYTGRTFTGAEAHELGLVDHLHPEHAVLEQAVAYARHIASSSSPVSMAAMKWQVHRAAETSLWEGLDDAETLTEASLAGRDFVEYGATLARDAHADFPPLPVGRLGDDPPLHLIPPASPAPHPSES
ncbi:MAG: enoyl-CoA hydratase-related protein [Actinomycetota bacterium]|nr:enoyl-CoA hydratase-related protein [Actinomycetota bacterium]